MTMNETDPPASEDAETNEVRRRAVLAQPHTVQAFRPLSATVKVDIAAASHRGVSRGHNDDHYLVARTGRSQHTLATSLSAAELPAPFEEYAYSMLVADGLGDAGTGSVASRVALSSIAHLALHHGQWNVRVDPVTAMEIMDRAQQLFSRADAEVFAKSMTGPLLTGIATSLTVAYSAGESLFVAHVGHSRAYLFRNGALTLLTRDHTMERCLASSKGPIPVERRAQDMGHILTDAVGAGGGTPLVDVEQFRLVDGDAVLLCTNGLTDAVEEGRIADVLARPRQPAEQCAILTDLVYQERGEDDVTVVLAQYHVPAS
jgi:serine/threonine protein phosphatase PrpC